MQASYVEIRNVFKRISINPNFWRADYKGFIRNLLKSEVYRNPLKNIHFPLMKHELIQQSIKHGVSYQILDELKNIPDREYTSANDVVKEFCGTRLR